jgi:hypothetical protein
VLLLAAAPAFAEDLGAAARASLWTAVPVVLRDNLGLGFALDGHRPLGGSPFFAGARVTVAASSESTAAWSFQELDVTALATVGARLRSGVGTLWAQAGAGALFADESLARQQGAQLDGLGLNAAPLAGWSVGPCLAAEAGVALVVHAPWEVALAAGPLVSWQKVDGGLAARWTGGVSLGVGRAF